MAYSGENLGPLFFVKLGKNGVKGPVKAKEGGSPGEGEDRRKDKDPQGFGEAR
jgi:hypothetical protein